VSNGSIKGLTVHGDVSATADTSSLAGGIVASLSNSTIEDCHFVGTVSATGEQWVYAGGVVGESQGSSIQGCTASVKLSTKNGGTETNPVQIAGGIVGTFQGLDKDKEVLTGCVADVEIAQSGDAPKVAGGVAGVWATGDYFSAPTIPPYRPSGNRWYGKGASNGINVLDYALPGVMPDPSDEGARKGTSAVILSRWLPEGRTGKAYDAQVVVAGTPKSWSISSGTLPEGLTFSNGAVKGVPTKTGRSTFTVKAGSSEQKFSIQIRNGSSNLDIETLELRPTAVGADYLAELEASGNVGAVTWSIIEGELPEGVDLSGSAISGAAAPGTAGTYTFTVMAQDSKGNGATQELTLTVTDGGGTPPEKESALHLSLQDNKTTYGPGEDLVLTVPAGVNPAQLEIDEAGKIIAMLETGKTAPTELIAEGAVLTVGGRTVAYIAGTPEGLAGAIRITVLASALDALRPGKDLEVVLSGVTADRLATLVASAGKISLTGGGGGEDPSGKKSGGGGCDMGLGGLAMMALAGAATRRKR
ncbi:MAG: putative Ig domain-containing protein, partial [Synergistaceae bacterium]|nr:putative Ig domain-containing protein [Synergistaceae bacterium]